MHRIPALDGLRAVACLLVIAFHAKVPGFAGGWLGVDIFFVLSGYVITRLLMRELTADGQIDLPAFWVRRIARLYPALLVLVVAVLALSITHISQPHGSVVIGATIALAYVTDFAVLLGWRGAGFEHTWSLAVEEQFYLLWPLTLIYFHHRHRALALIGWGAALASVCFLAAGSHPDPSGIAVTYFTPQGRAYELLAGAGIAITGRAVPPPVARILGPACVGGLTAAVMSDGFFGRTNHLWASMLTVGVLAALLVLTVVSGWNPVLSWRSMQWIGERSYGMYLYHVPITLLAVEYLPVRRSIAATVILAATIGAAAVSYRWVEVPARDAARKRLARRGGSRYSAESRQREPAGARPALPPVPAPPA